MGAQSPEGEPGTAGLVPEVPEPAPSVLAHPHLPQVAAAAPLPQAVPLLLTPDTALPQALAPPPPPLAPSRPPARPAAPRRNLPGTPAASMWGWAPRPLAAEEGGALGILEHIQDLIREDASNIDKIYELPSSDADPLVWQYEHLRQFVIEFNMLLVALGDECTPETCPRMTASNEWQYLCAAHRKPQDCAAIDYMRHTIDGSTALLTNAKHFASRSEVLPCNAKYFQSMARRLYRIFAHVFYHHRQVFDEVEADSHLCSRFSHFVMRFKLMSPSMLLVPQDAYEARTT